MVIGVSPIPSRYRIRVSDQEVGLKCGPDILLNGLRSNLEADANCPVCGRPIRFRVRNTRVENLEPSEAILHAVETVEGPGKICVACDPSHIFDKEECLRAWLHAYRGIPGSVYTLQDYMNRIVALTAANHVAGKSC